MSRTSHLVTGGNSQKVTKTKTSQESTFPWQWFLRASLAIPLAAALNYKSKDDFSDCLAPPPLAHLLSFPETC